MAAKKKTINKSAFVRSLPASMPAKEVIAKAKAAGITFSDKYVYAVRSSAKVARKKARGAKQAGGAAVAASSSTSGATSKGGLIGEIERMVEEKVSELLRTRLNDFLK